MFRHVDDFHDAWAFESAATVKVLSALTDVSLSQRVTPEGRSLGTLAWHLTTTIPEMMNRTGLAVSGPEDGPVPSRATEITDAYEHAAQSLADRVRAAWTDASLIETHDMYGEQWANGSTLAALIGHQAHHRGQLTVLMRQAGLRVPGVYGPAREEWALMGRPPMD
jgi:uncharacterized damage-inducible protein DinB